VALRGWTVLFSKVFWFRGIATDRSIIHLNKSKEEMRMSEHHDVKKAREPHSIHEEHAKGPHDPKEINPKMASDIAYWSKEFGVTGDQLHEAIRSHGTHVEKVRTALHTKAV
jgi:Protein of unknown function (DUF3606)